MDGGACGWGTSRRPSSITRWPASSSPFLANHDPDRIEVHAFVNLAGEGDEVTARLRRLVPNWHPIHGRSDAEVAHHIAGAGIDVLVDLAGHTAGQRLGVFARRPAPVQITYLGYPATTGLARIDYRLTDELCDPPGQTEDLHTEELVRLPGGFLCFQPPDDGDAALSVGQPPSQRRDHITFGSFNDTSRLSPWMLDLWARLVARTPGARLLLKSRGMGDAGVRQRMLDLLRASGLSGDRVDLIGWKADRNQHLACYHQVDIALDCFPYNGIATTCEALWMGVPVLTRTGDTHVSRVGRSLLTAAGLPDLCAATDAEFMDIGQRLAADRQRLRTLRAGMRNQLKNSPLLDARRFTRKLEETYRTLFARKR